MPSVIAPVIIEAALGAGLSFGTGIFIAKAVIALGTAVVLGAVSSALTKKPKLPDQANLAFAARDRLISARQPIAPWRVVYGRVRTGGTFVFLHTTGSSNEYFHVVLVLAGHQVESIGNPYFDGVEVPLDGNGDATGDFAGHVTVVKRLGTADQTAVQELIDAASDKWTSDHRLRGRAYAYLKLKWNADLFPNGLPNITFEIEGKNDIRDPRTSPETVGYTANWALCLADYLANATFGLGADTATEIDETDLIAAANVCDETVELNDGESPPGTEARYEMNGAFEVSEKPVDVLERMLTAAGGRLSYIGGAFHIKAAAWPTPDTRVLTIDDLRGPVRITSRVTRRDGFNAVKGVFVAPDNDWQPSDFPPVTSATYLAEDQDERVWKDIDLGFTTSAACAQRLAKIELERARRQITVQLSCGIACWRYVPGDVVKVTLARFGWTEKTFEVTETGLALAGGEGAPAWVVNLTLRETDANVYAWTPGTDETAFTAAPRTTLPDPFAIPAPTAVTATSGTAVLYTKADGTVVTRIKLAWTDPASVFVRALEVQAKRSADSAWEPSWSVPLGVGQAFVWDAEDGASYDLRIRAVGGLATSDWVTVAGHTVVGKTALPSDVGSLGAQQNGPVVTFRYQAIADLDRAGYELRYMSAALDFDWDAAQVITKETKGTLITNAALPPGAWRIGVKAIDTSGNYSANATTTTITVTNTNTEVYSNAEAPRWPGAKAGFLRHEVRGVLVPDSQDADATDDGVFDEMVPNPVAAPTYDGEALDLGFDANGTRLWAEIAAALGPGQSGTPDAFLQVDARDQAGSFDGYEDWTVGTADGRHIKFRLTEDTAGGAAVVSAFTPKADVAEDTVQLKDQAIPPGGATLTFPTPFHAAPGIAVSAEETADSPPEARFPNYGAVTATGVFVRVYDATGADVGGTVTVTATGPLGD